MADCHKHHLFGTHKLKNYNIWKKNGIIEVLTFARSCLFLICIRFSHNIQSYLKATEAESLISAHFHLIQLHKLFKAKRPIVKLII